MKIEMDMRCIGMILANHGVLYLDLVSHGSNLGEPKNTAEKESLNLGLREPQQDGKKLSLPLVLSSVRSL